MIHGAQNVPEHVVKCIVCIVCFFLAARSL